MTTRPNVSASVKMSDAAPQCMPMDSEEQANDDAVVAADQSPRVSSHSLRQIDRAGARAILDRRCPPDRRWAPGFPTDGDLEAARLFVRRVDEGEEPGPFGIFEILEGPDEEVVGGIGFHRPPGVDGAVEVGYGVVSSHWNRGICTEALRAIVAFARENGALRVEARSLPSNGASRRVMEKVGLHFVDVVDGYTRYEIRFD
jgi:RimJ/RimL family protein N-acetyltransferase